jgi:hypothetical protein
MKCSTIDIPCTFFCYVLVFCLGFSVEHAFEYSRCKALFLSSDFLGPHQLLRCAAEGFRRQFGSPSANAACSSTAESSRGEEAHAPFSSRRVRFFAFNRKPSA